MDEAEELSALVGAIYDASLDPSLWPGALRNSARFVRGWSAGLISKDPVHKEGLVYFDDGVIGPRYTELYFDKYIKLDPTSIAHYFGEIDEPVTLPEIMSYEEIYETRVYKEWCIPQGIVDFVSTVLDKSESSAAMFGVFRHKRDGLVDAEMCRRMRLVSPHIRRAVLISRVIERKTVQADTFAETLDGLSAGMFIVGANGHIVHANAAGLAMLAEGSSIRSVSGRLVAGDADADSALKDFFIAASLGDNAIGTRGISVPLMAREGEQLVAHALPLTSGVRRDAGKTHKGVAALFVHKAPQDAPAPPEVIAKLFKLTPMELRVLLGIVEVGGAPEVAEALGIAPSTVNTHLKHLYAKTGTNRQADLVKLIAKFSSPLV